MRLLAGFLFHLMAFLRVPLILVLRIGSIFFFLSGLATLVYMPLGHRESMLQKMFLVAFGSSFGLYMVGVGYDRILLAVNRARFRTTRSLLHGSR